MGNIGKNIISLCFKAFINEKRIASKEYDRISNNSKYLNKGNQ